MKSSEPLGGQTSPKRNSGSTWPGPGGTSNRTCSLDKPSTVNVIPHTLLPFDDRLNQILRLLELELLTQYEALSTTTTPSKLKCVLSIFKTVVTDCMPG